MKGRRVSGTLLFVGFRHPVVCGFPARCCLLLLVGHELIEKVARATITPAHHRINQMLHKKLLKSRSSREAFPGPRTVVPRPAIEESASGHRGSDSPLNYPDRTVPLMKTKAMSTTVVRQHDYKHAAGH